MKFLNAMLAATLILAACDNDDDIGPSDKTFTVDSYNGVDIGSNAVLKFDSDVPSGEVRISGRAEDVSRVLVEVNGGVLSIRTNDELDLGDSLTVSGNFIDVTDITLEANQKAVIRWNDDDEHDILRIRTEANSVLEVYQLQATQVDVQQEAQSSVALSSWVAYPEDSIKVLKTDVVQIDDNTFFITDQGIVIIDSFEELDEDGSEYYVLRGDEIKNYFITPLVNLNLEATSDFFGEDMPIMDLDVNLEGESEARVWVLDRLTGKGEGSSILHLKGDPEIEYVTEGGAEITVL